MSGSLGPEAPAASCSICRDAFTEASEATALACGHVFHARCATVWLTQNPSCPQCRRPLRDTKRDQLRVFLSFGDAAASDADKSPELGELRHRLTAASEQAAQTARRLRHWERQGARMRRDLDERQRQLRDCQAALAALTGENGQLMQMLAQEAAEAEAKLTGLRGQLEAEKRLTVQLTAELESERDSSETLEDERDRLTEQLLTRESEAHRLYGQLNEAHADLSALAGRLRDTELRAGVLADAMVELAATSLDDKSSDALNVASEEV